MVVESSLYNTISLTKTIYDIALCKLCFPLFTTVYLQWVGPIDDLEAEFAKIDKNGGGQILFGEFVDWALEKDLDVEDDVEPED